MPGMWGVAQDLLMIFPLSQEASWPLLPFSLVCDGINCLKSVCSSFEVSKRIQNSGAWRQTGEASKAKFWRKDKFMRAIKLSF